MRYLYIVEDGSLKVNDDAPTDEELEAVIDGTLEIVKPEVIRGEIEFRRCVVTKNEGEGDSEVDEYEVDWELLR